MTSLSQGPNPGDLSQQGGAPETIYEQGMAHYQRREWRQALDYFKRVKSADPNWPGIDALIDEVSWFLQLEQVGPGQGPAAAPAADTFGERSWPAGTRASRSRTLRWLLPVGLAAILLAVVAWWQGWIPGIGTRLEREALYNRGQASLAAGDYEGAREAFAELARLAPDNPAAQEGLDRAARLEQLTQAYQAAKSAIDAEDWPTARTRLQQVVAVDPAYADASELVGFVERQDQASALFKSGVASYDEGNWPAAIEKLERLAEMDTAYERDAVRELLFISYLRDGQALTSTPAAGADAIRQAIGRFGKALALRPRNVQAAAESRLASQYLAVREALDRQDWRTAEDGLQAIRRERPDYAGGQAAQLYFEVLVHRAEQARSANDLDAARDAYQAALALNVPDTSQAQAGLTAVAKVSTPTPSAAPGPTPFVESQTDLLNVRIGPGTDYPIIGQVTAGERLALVGRNAASDWLVVCCVDDQPGWVAARLVRTEGDVAALPVGLPPTRVPTPTVPPAPRATATPTASPTVLAVPAATPTPLPDSGDDGGGGVEPPPTDTPPPR